jgi:tetratricopeptide (TPR) repeat protein
MVASAPNQAFQSADRLEALLQRATEKLQAGRLEEAQRRYRDIAAHHPEQPGAWYLLGLAARKAGDRAGAYEAFSQAARLRPAQPQFQLHLGRICRAQGRYEEAKEALSAACLLNPGSLRARLQLALTQLAAGAPMEGLAAARRVPALACAAFVRLLRDSLRTPWEAAQLAAQTGSHPAAARAQVVARRLVERDETERAISILSRTASQFPADMGLRRTLAETMRHAGGHAGALEHYERVRESEPEDSHLAAGHALSLARLGRPREALALLDRLPEAEGRAAACQRARGWALYHDGRMDAALDAFSEALRQEPGNPAALHARGVVLRSLGRNRVAAAALEAAIAANSTYAPAYLALAAMGRIDRDSDLFRRLCALADSPDLPRRARCQLNFAAGRVLRDAGDTDAAIARLHDANRLKDVVFSAAAWQTHIDRLMETFNSRFFCRFEGLGNPDARPVFVVGMPRSGTSLVEQILASHPDAAGAGELEEINAIAEELGRQLDGAFPRRLESLNGAWTDGAAERYLKRLEEAGPTVSRVVDKMPTNFLHLGLIACLFPRARVINCRRDPLDTCLSIYALDFTGHHHYAYSLENLGVYYREHERLMNHWRKVLPIAMLDVDYETLVEDQEGQTRRLLAFCDLPWDSRCLHFHDNDRAVRTASFAQVRQPIYRGSLGWSRAYARHLGPLKAALRDHGGVG